MKLEKAQIIAQGIVDKLSPFCDQCLIAGSVRREAEDVKDIEVVILRKTYIPGDFSSHPVALAREIRALGNVKKGDPISGRYVQIHSYQGIMIDLFLPQPFDFWRIFAIRTGSRAYSQNIIARGWNLKGWVGTADGLRLELECERRGKAGVWKCVFQNPTLPPSWASEEQFFEWLNVPFVPPTERDTAQESISVARPYLTAKEKIEMGYFTPTPEDDGKE